MMRVLAIVGSASAGHTLRTLYVTLLTWGCHMLGKKSSLTGALAAVEELAGHQAAIDEVALAIVDAYSTKKNERPPLLSLMAFSMWQSAWGKEPLGSYDLDYWRKRGWLEAGCSYYYRHRAHPLKVASARMAGSILSRCMR